MVRTIDAYRPEIARLADELLDRMEAEGETDIVRGFARVLPLIVVCELLGLEGQDKSAFMRWPELQIVPPESQREWITRLGMRGYRTLAIQMVW